MHWNIMKSFKFTTFYNLEAKVKALAIIQWSFFGNRSMFERAVQRAFEKKQLFLGYSVPLKTGKEPAHEKYSLLQKMHH